MTFLRKRNGQILAAVALIAAGGIGAAKANSVTFTTTLVNHNGSDGYEQASVVFTAINGGIEITLTNLLTGSNASSIAKGQTISSLTFNVNGITTPTDFTKLTGVSYNPAGGTSWDSSVNGTAFSDTSAAAPINDIDHWGFSPTGSSVLLATAGDPVPGSGNPHYLILPGVGTAGSSSSLANSNFDPFIIGPANFFLTDANITANTNFTTSTFSSVLVGFGTGPDFTDSAGNPTLGGGVGSSPSTPLPAAAWGGLALMGSLLVGKRLLRKPRTA